jgi:hypothetical protein
MIARIGVVPAFTATGQPESTGVVGRPPDVATFYNPMTSATRAAVSSPSELTAIHPAAATFVAQQAAQSAALALSGRIASGAFGNSQVAPAAAPASVGPTMIVAATPSVAVPGVTSVQAPAAAVDTSAAVGPVADSGGGGSAPTASAPAGVAVSATAPAAAPAKAGLTTTEVVAIAAGVLGIAGFLLARRGKGRR